VRLLFLIRLKGGKVKDLMINPMVLIALCGILGTGMGAIGWKQYKLGSSGVLFAGLLISYLYGKYGLEIEIPKVLLQLSLVGFIMAVGLKASKNIRGIIQAYGFRFVLLALSITATGALSTGVMMAFYGSMKYELVGTYVGSLTSSPGLATALELADTTMGSFVGLGYALAYVPGVILVILFSQWTGSTSKGEIGRLDSIEQETGHRLSIMKLALVGLGGIGLGSLKVFGISLGITGGVLVISLLLGANIKAFRMQDEGLNIIRDLGLTGFLAIVGLKYGHTAVVAVETAGLQLLTIGLITATCSLAVGFVFGKYVLKIEDAILVGGICGGMTSTPGLAAASEAFKSDHVTAGYGATYPFALIGMIVFTNILI